MKQLLWLNLFTLTLFISGCVEDDPAPKCNSKAISYKEFQDYQKSQNTWKSTDDSSKETK